MDPRNVNGGVFLGLNGVVVKSHGGTDALGFATSLRIALEMADSRFLTEIEQNLRACRSSKPLKRKGKQRDLCAHRRDRLAPA
jgi:fatty acid/phospholipid biosynthesis enzyme